MAEEIIEIQGDLIRRISRNVVSESNLKDIIPFMEHRVPVTLPILPQHPVRSAYWNESTPEKTLHLLIETPPAVRTITFYEDGTELRPTLSMPWTIWNFVTRTRGNITDGSTWTLDDIRIYWAKEQITSLDQDVIPAMMPNTYSDASICFGDTGTDPYQPLAERIDQIINDFYMSAFNDDLGRRWPFGDLATWEERTAEDRGCWKDFPEWDPADTTLNHLKLADIFTYPTDRSTPRSLGNDIPPLAFLPTFGRAREWLDGLTNAQRLRLHTEIVGMWVDSPELFAMQAETTDD